MLPLRIVPTMDLGEFVVRLQSRGAMSVDASDAVPVPGRLDTALEALDAAVKLDAPAGMPPLDLVAGRWAAALLYQACALLGHRQPSLDEVARRLGGACPANDASPATHYSVDLVLRHLPALLDAVPGASSTDPLRTRLLQIAAAWPLSSVGIVGMPASDPTPLLVEDGLRRFYVDRLLRRGERARLGDPRLAAAVQAALGEHTGFARALFALDG